MPTADELHALLVAAELTFAGTSTVGPTDAESLLAQTLESAVWRADDGSLRAVALAFGHGEGVIEIDRGHPELWPAVTGWLVERAVREVQCLEADAEQLAALAAAGWSPAYGAYDLQRPASPVGVTAPFADWTATSPAAVHDCIYSVWGEVEGHVVRPLDEWTRLFADGLDPTLQVVGLDADIVTAVAICRIEPDGLGWVPQLAVRREAQGQGLGRRVLVEAVRRLQAAGAHGVGLSVNAPNQKALRVYESLGFARVSAWITSRR